MARQSNFKLLIFVASAFAGQAIAQDPAYVGDGNYYDPANVNSSPGTYARVASSAYDNGNSLGGLFGSGQPSDAESGIQGVEALLKQVNAQMSGPRSSDPIQDYAISMQLKSEAEKLIREHWGALGPATRDQYSRVYGQPAPGTPNSPIADLVTQTMRAFNGDYGGGAQGGYDAEALLFARGQQDAHRVMQDLEDLLMPMLRDIKRSLDAEIQRASNR